MHKEEEDPLESDLWLLQQQLLLLPLLLQLLPELPAPPLGLPQPQAQHPDLGDALGEAVLLVAAAAAAAAAAVAVAALVRRRRLGGRRTGRVGQKLGQNLY